MHVYTRDDMRHPDPACAELSDRLDAAATVRSVDELAGGLERHLAGCQACAGLVERQRGLVRLLSSAPEAPQATFDPPSLPRRAGGRLLPLPAWLAAAAAAAVFVVAGLRLPMGPAERVRVDRVVDVAGAPPPVDERLLALTAGSEAVAMRRPTELR